MYKILLGNNKIIFFFFLILHAMIINKSQMRNIILAKFKLPLLTKEGRNGKEDNEMKSLMNTSSNVNEEYKQAFRTKSYVEIRNKVHCQLETSCYDDLDEQLQYAAVSLSSSSSFSPSTQYLNLSEFLLEPRDQESLLIPSNFHKFLVNHFEISHEASRACESLLANIKRARDDHRSIEHAMALIQEDSDIANWTQDRYCTVYENLASFASRRNPFPKMAPRNFHELRNSHVLLLHDLTSQCKKTGRKKKLISLFKRGISCFLAMGFGALAIVLFVLTIHCTMGLVAAPGLGIWALAYFIKKRAQRKRDKKWPDGLVAKLDVAARGVFIMTSDFDTMSRIVKRLHEEMEHWKFVADICVRKGKNGMLKEVVREFQTRELWFLEQLDELEKQIYLCFLDINRSRRLLVREIVKC